MDQTVLLSIFVPPLIECPLWVISVQTVAGQNPPLSALVQKRTNAGAVGMSAKCH